MSKDTIFKEATDFCKAMRCKVFDVLVMAELWVISTDGYNFVVFLALVYDMQLETREIGLSILI